MTGVSRPGAIVRHATSDFTVKTVQKAVDLAGQAGSRLYRLSGIFGEIMYALLSSSLDRYGIRVYSQDHGDS